LRQERHSGEEYLSAIDQVISWAATHGAYSILDLQWFDAETIYGSTKHSGGATVANHVPPLPNRETISLWNTLAIRYRDEPALWSDLLNELHDRLEDDCNPIYLVNPAGEIIESDTGRRLAAEIRSRGLGWSAWSWADHPNLVVSSHAFDYYPTAFGELVRNELWAITGVSPQFAVSGPEML
jgi:hypothetical protein